MLRFICLAVVIASAGCGQRNGSDATHTEPSANENVSIPFERAVGFRDGYLLQVPREGPFLWNGMPEDTATIGDWINQYAQAKGAGRLWLEFEPKTPARRTAWVRQHVLDSGLCAQSRCVETDWNAKWSVVN